MDSDQIDGGSLSHDKKKGAKESRRHEASSEWGRRIDLPIVQTNVSAPIPTDDSTVISVGPHHWPTVSIEPDDYTYTDEWNKADHPAHLRPGAAIPKVSKQTMDELKSLLRERSVHTSRDEDQLVGHHCHKPGQRIDCKPDDIPYKSFTTFKPTLVRRTRDSASSGLESDGSSRTAGHTNRPTTSKVPTSEGTYLVNTGTSRTGQ